MYFIYLSVCRISEIDVCVCVFVCIYILPMLNATRARFSRVRGRANQLVNLLYGESERMKISFIIDKQNINFVVFSPGARHMHASRQASETTKSTWIWCTYTATWARAYCIALCATAFYYELPSNDGIIWTKSAWKRKSRKHRQISMCALLYTHEV